MSTPNPGSDEALDQGCLCAVIDNAHGKGYMGMEGVFSMNGDCPMHGFEVSQIRAGGQQSGKRHVSQQKVDEDGEDA